MFEVVVVDIQNLVTSLQPSLGRARAFLHFRDEDAAAALDAAQDGEVEDLALVLARDDDRAWARLRCARDVQETQLAAHLL